MKTKIVATIGPSSEDISVLSKMVESGMDIARMNFSHCTHDEYKKRREIINIEAARLNKKVSILQDLQGPRIRVGNMPESGRSLVNGELVYFSANKEDNAAIFIDEPTLPDSIEVGHPIYLSSGDIELVVKDKTKLGFSAEVVRAGVLFSRKGVNVPETRLSVSSLTDKDWDDLEFALSLGVEYVAVSFVQSGDDIRNIKNKIKGRAKIISKIETAQALHNIDDIIKESDSIMIARGDLGVEVAMEKVPFIQKKLINQAHSYKKESIVATQMLLSMMKSKKPTRAEVSDVANAVIDGADMVMLSDETANGDYPVESLETMIRIVRETERLRELYSDTTNISALSALTV